MTYTPPLSGKLPFEQRGHLISSDGTADVFQVPGDAPLFLSSYHECSFCGERPERSLVDGVVYAATECPFPDGVTSKVTLNVPSGKLIVTDDLRPLYEIDDTGFASYNTALGQAQVVEAMAGVGCAYGPVGNSCPGLYRLGPDSFVIANPPYDEEGEDDDSGILAERLAGVVTDLWAYSIADFDDWVARGGDPAALGWTESVVEVTPGVYEFTHHTGERTFDRDSDGIVVYAHVERVS